MSNVIEVYPIAGKTAYTASAWQYDYGQTLHLNGIVLPASYKAEFSNTTRGNAIPTVQTTDTVAIPAQFLESGEPVYIWLVMVDSESRTTEYSVIVPIAARAKPTDEEPAPEEQSEIDQALAALNGGVDLVERIAGAIPDTIEDALTEAKESGEFDGADGKDGYTPQKGIDYFDGEDGKDGKDGKDGADGQTGPVGAPGISPSIAIADITGGHRVIITDAEGQHSFDVMNGEDAVQDVQVNGVSVLQDGVANVPTADVANGVVPWSSIGGYGVYESYGKVRIEQANSTLIRQGSVSTKAITPQNQHYSAFYGLAKAAGSDEKDSVLLVGQYTESAKSAIQTMLSGPVTVSGTTPFITALPGIQYVCGECATLDITLPASGCIDVVFESGSTPTVLTVTPPNGVTVKWANGFDPDNLEANTTYEINIKDGLGVAASWT